MDRIGTVTELPRQSGHLNEHTNSYRAKPQRLTLTGCGQGPLVDPPGPGTPSETKIAETTARAADLPLVGTKPLREIGVRSVNTARDLAQEARRQGTRFEERSLLGQSHAFPTVGKSAYNDEKDAVDLAALVRAGQPQLGKVIQVAFEPLKFRPGISASRNDLCQAVRHGTKFDRKRYSLADTSHGSQRTNPQLQYQTFVNCVKPRYPCDVVAPVVM